MWMWILEVRSEKGCGKWHFLGWTRVRIWRTRRYTPTENYPEYPLGSETALSFSNFPIVKVMGEESGNLESACGINLSSFTYEVNKWDSNEICEVLVRQRSTNVLDILYTFFLCLRLTQPVLCLPALFLLCFNIIILCGIISLLPPYKTFGNEAFPKGLVPFRGLEL